MFDIGPLRELFRPMISGAWELKCIEMAPCRGYWSGVQMCFGLILLTRGEDTWMSLAPVEIESQILGVEAARGHVAIMGLGMGWAASETALREEVAQITIVEHDPEAIALHEELDLFARLPGGVGEKIRIVEADAYAWVPDTPVDLLMPDIWLPLVGGHRVADVARMQDNVQAPQVYFWGQELEIARHAAASGRLLDEAGIAATVAGFDLPLLIPDAPDYPGKIKAAASQWMNDNWFEEGHAAILTRS
ncbi:hypothetical protein [Parerythrobacter jejuensis]|uniref:Spermidine synthase n=1 Tax=Parerythrobacter jejuensis TaxID=795812 RepID=A0A845AWM7_9SPHN|nr:hypothetical protein [Parerythrobacter jejuensis]MXP31188.1 hypothetical protein [Parerythrobacter jejuensis]MXP33948.1 hypothetical protein [Parerythrobacter jejuensis]